MVISDRDRENLSKNWAQKLINPVKLSLVEGAPCQYCPMLKELLLEIAEISNGKIEFQSGEFNPLLQKFLGVNHGPVVLIGDKGHIRYTGAPLGQETWGFLETIRIVSTNDHNLEQYADELRDLEKTIRIETVVTPSCPYCPYAVLVANRIAQASGGKVISDTIEAYEFPEIARKWGVTSVPTVIISVDEPYSGEVFKIGVPNEKELIWKILKEGRE